MSEQGGMLQHPDGSEVFTGRADQVAARELDSIDITPSWASIIELHLGVLDGTIRVERAHRDQAREDARIEIRRLARFADRVNGMHIPEWMP